jgi:hypothetical protein
MRTTVATVSVTGNVIAADEWQISRYEITENRDEWERSRAAPRPTPTREL